MRCAVRYRLRITCMRTQAHARLICAYKLCQKSSIGRNEECGSLKQRISFAALISRSNGFLKKVAPVDVNGSAGTRDQARSG